MVLGCDGSPVTEPAIAAAPDGDAGDADAATTARPPWAAEGAECGAVVAHGWIRSAVPFA